jgi:hypothetical protein
VEQVWEDLVVVVEEASLASILYNKDCRFLGPFQSLLVQVAPRLGAEARVKGNPQMHIEVWCVRERERCMFLGEMRSVVMMGASELEKEANWAWDRACWGHVGEDKMASSTAQDGRQ